MDCDSDFEVEYVSQKCMLSENLDCQGFDNVAGQAWIYPTNYPIRDYQFNIIEHALYKNTLVSLPTGLGKTFIAAVVMYNFYRWYPNGKIIFIAPTKPLVRQQIDACYNIMAIPEAATIELTGTREKKLRAEDWKLKRVFFVTPQVLQNDLLSVDELAPKIRCVVFDEAHKAKGNHAYCEVVRKLIVKNALFRVLALSATPGNSVADIKEVIQNLLISHLEFRTEESGDVKQYVFERKLETVVVPLDNKLQQVKENYLELLERYTRCLIKYKIIQGNYSTLTKGKIFMVLKDFQEKNRHNRQHNSSEILKNLNICVTLYHAYELLIRHGLRSFLSFFQDHIDKPLLRGNIDLIQLMEDVKCYLGGTLAVVEPLPDGTHTETTAENIKCGHPKFYKLQEILVNHFENENTASRTIVFFEYRESVKEAYALLLKNNPLIRPKIFLGQGSGVTQRVQMGVIQAFRDGHCNTLLSTCIGEEGLDVGEVDLIVCFDISNKSPIRIIQRMGRTGRKREGRVVILVTEGKEQQTLQECLMKKKYLGSNLSTSPDLHTVLYSKCPRMLPENITPKCEKIYITVKKSAIVKKNMNLKDMFKNINHPVSSVAFEEDGDFKPIKERIPDPVSFWDKNDPLSIEEDNTKINFSKTIDANRRLQPCNEIKHSRDTNILVDLLQMVESKRYNIPVTQQNLSSYHTKTLKQGDIRNIFKRALSDSTPSQVCPEDILLPLKTQPEFYTNESHFTGEIINEMSDYLTILESLESECRVCNNLFKCPENPCFLPHVNLDDWIQPNPSKLCTIRKEDLKPVVKQESSHINKVLTYNNSNPHGSLAVTESDTVNVLMTHTESTMNYMSEKEMEMLLSFFKLTCLADLFRTEAIVTRHLAPEVQSPPKITKMPASPESPILCTYSNVQRWKANTKTTIDLFGSETNNDKCKGRLNLKGSEVSQLAIKESQPSFKHLNSSFHCVKDHGISDFGDVEDIFDLSVFEGDRESKCSNVGDTKLENGLESTDKETTDEMFDANDICDLSIFGLSVESANKRKLSQNDETEHLAKKKRLNDSVSDFTMEPSASNENANHSEKSQVSITQILSLVDKQKTVVNHSAVKTVDHFKEFLDKMK